MNRFEQEMKKRAELESDVKEFMDAGMELAKEICQKGIENGADAMTDAESRFIKAQAMFVLRGLIMAQK